MFAILGIGEIDRADIGADGLLDFAHDDLEGVLQRGGLIDGLNDAAQRLEHGSGVLPEWPSAGRAGAALTSAVMERTCRLKGGAGKTGKPSGQADSSGVGLGHTGAARLISGDAGPDSRANPVGLGLFRDWFRDWLDTDADTLGR
jgi:hypothetical protein